MNTTPLEKWILEDIQLSCKYREELDSYQLRKIKEVINYAKLNGNYYKKHLGNIDTENIASLNEFRKIPFTYPNDIIENPNAFLCVSQSVVKRIVTLQTSSTTGNGKRIFFTENDLNMTVDFFLSGFQAMVNSDDRVMIMMPGNSYGSVGDIIKKSLDKLNVTNFIYGAMENSNDAANFIIKNKINSIVALPMQVLYLSIAHEEVFRNIKNLMLSADYVPEVLIHRLKNKFNCHVLTHYGMTETGYGCAVECEALEGYHYRENHIYLEIINPITGENLEDGNGGEIVVTTFNREAMPLIRYRTGDWGAFKTYRCKCGTFLKTLQRSRGRINNKICFNDNDVIYIREFDELFFRYENILDYKMNIENSCLNITLYLYEDERNINDIKKSVHSFLNKRCTHNVVFNLNIGHYRDIVFQPNTMIKRSVIIK